MIRTEFTLSGGAALLALSLASGAAPAQETEFNIEAQPLVKALLAFNDQSGRTVAAPHQIVADKSAPAVRGEMEPEEALDRILAGTGLKSTELPGGGYTISLVSTDATGLGKFQLASSPVLMAQNQTSSRQTSSEASSRSDESIVMAEGTELLDVIVVTGTNIRGADPVGSKVIVLQRAEIDATGLTTTEDLIRTLPQAISAGVSQENFGGGGGPVGDVDPVNQGAGVNLRGLGQRATLVLLNGNRVASSGQGAFVDVSLLPLSVVERVEVLPDGASALYGSDAVGGVLNIILRDSIDGLKFSGQVGTTTDGGGNTVLASPALGRTWNTGNAMIAYEFRDHGSIKAGDRDFTVNIPADSLLIPEESRNSIVGAVNQEFSESFSVDINGLYASRETQRDFLDTLSLERTIAEAESDILVLSGQFTYDMPRELQLRAGVNYSINDATSTFDTPESGAFSEFNFENEITNARITVDGSVLSLAGGEVRAAIGAETRSESFSRVSRTGIATTIEDRDRDVNAVFAEVSVPIFSDQNAISGFQELEVSAAIRYEDYSDFGSTTDPKFGLSWRPFDSLRLRGTYSTSYRAPLLNEAGGTFNSFIFFFSSLAANPDVPEGIPLLLLGDAPELGPETSDTWTVGLDYQPTFAPNFSISTSYFNTEFSDRIALPTGGNFSIIGDPAFESVVTENPDQVLVLELINGSVNFRDFLNLGFAQGAALPVPVDYIVDSRVNNTAITSTDGLDFSLNYDIETGEHDFRFSFDSTFLFSFDDQLSESSPANSPLGDVFGPADFRGRAGARWGYRDWGANLFVNYTDDYTDSRFESPRPVDDYTTVDVNIGKEFIIGSSRDSSIRLNLIATNLFNEQPPEVSPPPGSDTGVGYDSVNASARGRVIAISLSADF